MFSRTWCLRFPNPTPYWLQGTIKWGDQSWDEVIFGRIGVVVLADVDLDKAMAVGSGNAANLSLACL